MIAQLEQEIKDQEAKLNTMSPFSDEYRTEQEKLNDMIAKRDAEEDTQGEINTAVYTALEGIPIAFILTTDNYGLEEKIDIIAKALSNEFEKAGEVERSLRRELKGQELLIAELRSERDAANAEAFDLQSKLKNAAEQLDEEKRSSKEKDEEINRLRETLSKSGTVPIKSYQDSKEEHQKALDSRPAIYDVEWTDTLKKTHYTAKRAETGEQMEPFSRLTLGLYRVLGSEEVERFRKELEEKRAQEEMEQLAKTANDIEAPSVTFQSENDPLQTDSASGEVAEETVSRAEFEEVKARLAKIEERFAPTTAVA